MSKIFKTQYSAYQRHILAEFMSKEQLNKLDARYTAAKILRSIKSSIPIKLPKEVASMPEVKRIVEFVFKFNSRLFHRTPKDLINIIDEFSKSLKETCKK